MKKILFAGIATLALAGMANAADLPRKMPVKAAPPAPMWNWTGFYLGGFYGTSVQHARGSSSAQLGETNVNDIGATFGGTVGYNWQFSPSWLIGVEGDIGWLGTESQFADYNDRNNLFVGSKMEAYATARARFGYVTGPSLIYGTVGGAWVRTTDTFGLTAAPTELTSTRSGWTAGGGIETKLSRSWTTKTEYLYIDVGSDSFTTNAAGGGTATVSNRAHVIKKGFTYQFGNGPFEMFPFMAKPFSSPERWAGFYSGVNVGGAISGVNVSDISFIATGVGRGNEQINGAGFAGGGHVGYNVVAFSNWIVGVEGDIGYLGVKHSYGDWVDNTVTFGVKTDWYGTLRGRIGTSTGPAFLYFTGGGAFAKVENTFSTASISGTRAGWAIGGGIETELGPRWSARLETLYMNFGKDSLDLAGTHVEFENRFQVVRAGVSYKFGGPDVVTARY